MVEDIKLHFVGKLKNVSSDVRSLWNKVNLVAIYYIVVWQSHEFD